METTGTADLPVKIDDVSEFVSDREVLSRLGKERPCEIEIETLVAAYATLVDRLGVEPISFLAVVDCLTAVVERETGDRIQLELVTGVDSVDRESVDRLEPLLCEGADLLVVTDSPVERAVETLCEHRNDVDYVQLPIERRSRQ